MILAQTIETISRPNDVCITRLNFGSFVHKLIMPVFTNLRNACACECQRPTRKGGLQRRERTRTRASEGTPRPDRTVSCPACPVGIIYVLNVQTNGGKKNGKKRNEKNQITLKASPQPLPWMYRWYSRLACGKTLDRIIILRRVRSDGVYINR